MRAMVQKPFLVGVYVASQVLKLKAVLACAGCILHTTKKHLNGREQKFWVFLKLEILDSHNALVLLNSVGNVESVGS